jgi:large exoprotein involved in heme utilization and adhesion
LSANGQVWLINPNGILFGRDAQVNVGGLVASTLELDDRSLASSTRRFLGGGAGRIVNLGRIEAVPGGYVALLGHQVVNQGVISARLGTVALAGGSATTLSFDGDSLIRVVVDNSALDALAENGGLIKADGGRVYLSAGARDSLLASVVNNTGIVEAQTVENRNGDIVLLGGMAAGTTQVGGLLDASAPAGGDGGFIETSAARVKVKPGAQVTTASSTGRPGTWQT